MLAFLGRGAFVLAILGSLSIAGRASAAISNPGFESGDPVTNPDNADPWDWTPDNNGERVNALTNHGSDNGDGTLGTHLIDPFSGSWFGYVENSASATTAAVSQSVTIDGQVPVLEFWWRFFTNETPGEENTFNDRFQVNVEGSISLTQTVASVNGTAMITTNGPLFSPTGGPPGLNQSFARYTAAWAYYALDVSAMAGETVTVNFRQADVGGPHNQSSGFALDNVQFVAPEPTSLGLLAAGGLLVLRRRKA